MVAAVIYIIILLSLARVLMWKSTNDKKKELPKINKERESDEPK